MFLSYVAGAFAVLMWSILPAIVKICFHEVSIPFFLFLRFGISAVISLFFFKSLWQSLKQVKKTLIVQISVVLGLNYLLQALALNDLPASWYIVIFALNPILTAILIGVRFNLKIIFGFLFAITGVLLFILPERNELQNVTFMAFIYLFSGMLTWVLYTVIAKKIQDHVSDFSLMNLTNFLTFIPVTLIWLYNGHPTQDVMAFSMTTWFAILFSSLGLPVAYYSYLYSLRRTPLFCQMSQYLELVFGVIFTVIIGGEPLTIIKIAGISLVLGALSVARE